MKATMKKGAVALVLLGAVAGLYVYLMPRAGEVVTDNAYVQGEIAQISAEVAGVVTRVHVADNQFVLAGDLLAEVDARDYQALKTQAEGALAAAEAALANVRERIAMQEIGIGEAATRIEAARADAELQRAEWARYDNLLGKKLVAKSSADAQRTRMRQANASLEASRLGLASAKRQLGSLQTERAQRLAQRDQAHAALELASLSLEDTQIRAPISGVVGNLSVRKGRYVTKGTNLLAIVPVDDVWVEANYKETQITHIQPGQTVEVRLDSFPDRPLRGHVIGASPATGARFSLLPPDNATGNFVKIVQRVPVKIALDIPSSLRGRVVPGLSAEVAIAVGGRG
ncbi:HlyD family secretion protein [Aeromonas dhakensis]|uniref:HlyD family secretion protein n=1 Tax=Aeromonas dhakensis TaxID=196024 RepID=UPI0039885D4A